IDQMIALQTSRALATVSATGIVERIELPNPQVLGIFDGKLVVQESGNDDVWLYEPDTLERVRTLEDAGEVRAVAEVAGQLAILTDREVQLWEGREQRWSVAGVTAYRIAGIGNYLVASAWNSKTVTIFELDGTRHEVALAGVRESVAFGEGIVLLGERALWWKTGEPIVELEHDLAPTTAVRSGDDLVTAEGNQLYRWSLHEDGPAWTPVVTDIPMNVPIVVDGTVTRALAPRRFSVRLEHGVAPPDAPWRPATTREEALVIMQQLLAREIPEGDLPTLTSEPHEQHAEIGQLSMAARLPAVARFLFAPKKLVAETKYAYGGAWATVAGELAIALGTTHRLIHAAVRARKFPLVPPRVIEGYDYLGTFTTGEKVWLCDPCYFKKSTNNLIVAKLAVRSGLWHAFVRNEGDRTAELAAIHETGFSTLASEAVGGFGVDAGLGGIFDEDAPKVDLDVPVIEGIHAGQGVYAHSGWGDGMYTGYAGRIGREIVKLRLAFLDKQPEIDRTFAAPKGGRPYSIKTKFALGETVDHPKFGSGTVTNVAPDKVTVSFADGPRTLVHAKT
ncbi:MAG TPA: hypothetical protein VGC41_14225, partial [Kofleriaceae bacterium]